MNHVDDEIVYCEAQCIMNISFGRRENLQFLWNANQSWNLASVNGIDSFGNIGCYLYKDFLVI